MGIREVGRNALRPGYVQVMADKLVSRVTERDRTERARGTTWAQAHAAGDFAPDRLDPDLWAETRRYERRLRGRARTILPGLPYPLGGGGHWPLLRFLVRYLQPQVVVETGVAAGWTSAAILDGLQVNGRGELWSSDFPYFRLPDPERFVGVLVDEELRDRWHLLLKGDRRNLPEILSTCGPVDLFHFDSDKSYRGRTYATAMVVDQLTPDGLLIVDDIQDNMHFADLVTYLGWPHLVLPFGPKFVGLSGPGTQALITGALGGMHSPS